MNELVLTLGIEAWKPVLTALVMPPVPLLLLVLVGARLMFRRPLLAWALILLATLGIWFSATQALANALVQIWIKPPPALVARDVAELRHSPKTAIIVLGGGRRLVAPEYGLSTLKVRSVERLRYGVWLSRETGLPLGFSGGVGHGVAAGPSEAEIAARIAEREFGRALRWQEGESRDTRENALKTVALLQPQGIETIVLVTDALHMRRALGNFERAAEGLHIRIVAAPMGSRGSGKLRAGDWLPSLDGYEDVWMACHEALGRLLGA
jgi:uncharacterized SAM-binding protein YcdF (DUF218 family)